MQKSISIVLAFVFLLSSSGFTVTQNYCFDTGERTLLFTSDEPESCSCCDEPPLDDCCEKNEINILKVNEIFISSVTTSIYKVELPALILSYHNELNLLSTKYHTIDFNFDHDPPDKSVPRRILFSTFLV